jgi:16S rRNA (adenine1518-N6/adenine1519-N6)-dimethyltransferase
MPQTKHEMQAILSGLGIHPRQGFGQNFMIDQNLLRIVADAGNIHAGDWVLEVGPGTGSLTEELLERGAFVQAVEIDRRLAESLRVRFAGNERFALIESDVLAGKHQIHPVVLESLKAAPAPIRMVANLPYNIASPLAIELLRVGVELLVFTVQREVAQRLRAAAGQEAYGPLSVMAQLLADVEVLRILPPQAFWPEPKVDSALVRLKRNDRLGQRAGAFGAFVHQLFSARRKMLRKGLAQTGIDDPDALLAAAQIDGHLRVEEIPGDRLLSLFTLWSAVAEDHSGSTPRPHTKIG